MNATKVKLVLAFPKNRKKFGYYLNNNFTDKHSMNRDDFYLFLASLVKPPNTAKIKEYIDKNKNFIVDVESNAIAELELDPEDRYKKQIDHHTVNIYHALKQWRKQNKKSNSMYQEDIHNIYKQLGIK